jgi:putative ABC transport system permease protein
VSLSTSTALDHLFADLRYAVRGMRRAPGFYVTAVLMLALGIGINTAIFSLFSHVLLAPLQFPDADSLYVVSSHAASLGDARRANSGPDFRDYRDQNSVFTGVTAAIAHFTLPWVGDGEPRTVTCTGVTQDFFNVMQIRPALGRLYSPDDFHHLENSAVLVSWNFWKNQLGGDPHVIGRKLHLETAASEIIGVLPPMPDLYGDTDLVVTLTTEPSWPFMNWRANKFLDVIGRLKPGTTRRTAEQQLTLILGRAEGEPRDVQVQLTPLKEFIVGPVRQQLGMIMAAVALVLLVTCMNTAALLLSRAVKRAPELAVRLGLGASRGRIRQQLLLEGLVLSASGGALGVALAGASIGLVRHVPGLTLPRTDNLNLNVAAVLASLAVVLLTSILFALLPASMLSKLDVASGMRSGRTETGRAQRRPFSALIVGEVACAVVLTVCAGLLVRSFMRVQSVDLGFQPSRVLTAYLRNNYDDAKGLVFWSGVLERAANMPGAQTAAISDCLPGAAAKGATIEFGDRSNDPNHEPAAEGCWISAGYFRTLGSPLLKGRFFTAHDDDQAPPVVIINADAAQRFFPNEDPLGKRIAVKYLALGSRMIGPPRMREIVGIVSNVRQRAADLPSEPAVYLPYAQDETYHVLNSMNLFVRSAGPDAAPLANSIRPAIQSRYPNQPVERVTVMRTVVSRLLARRSYSMGLISAFAALALLLCALGIYGVVSYVTLQRTKEFGIRMALGAQRWNVICNVLQQGGMLIGAGVAIGILLSLEATRFLSQLLFETTAADPAIFTAAVLLLGLIGVLACVLPGLRASRLDPRQALNTD